jgi:hypothetical protein
LHETRGRDEGGRSARDAPRWYGGLRRRARAKKEEVVEEERSDRERAEGAPRRTGITLRDVGPPSGEVAFEGRRWRVSQYLADPFGERDLLELASEGRTIRLLGRFGANGEFVEIHRTRKGA